MVGPGGCTTHRCEEHGEHEGMLCPRCFPYGQTEYERGIAAGRRQREAEIVADLRKDADRLAQLALDYAQDADPVLEHVTRAESDKLRRRADRYERGDPSTRGDTGEAGDDG